MTTNDVDSIVPLHQQVDALEQRLALERSQLGMGVRGIALKLRARVVAPSSILTAVAFGVILEQGSRHRTWSLASVLQGLGVANTMFATLGSLVKSNGASDG